MNADRWERLTDLYHAAVALTAEERAALLDEDCADDPTLRAEIERMAAAHDRATDVAESAGERGGQTPSPISFGPYRILKEIGRSPLGTIYLAERDDGRFDQRVTITLLDRGPDAEATLEHLR